MTRIEGAGLTVAVLRGTVPRMRTGLLPAVAALAGAGFSAALLRNGVVLGPDSWAYWEGSVSLLEKGEYAYFGGPGITVFPPLFSWVLALSQAVLGVSLAAFVSAASFAWSCLYVVLSGRREGLSFHDLLVALYLPASLAIYSQALLSETLWLVLLPLLLIVLVAPEGSLRPAPRSVLAWLILSCMLLCRNATLTLLPAVLLLFLRLRGELGVRRRFAIASAVVAGSLVPWYWVVRSLGQPDSRFLGGSRHGVLEYSIEALRGLAYAFGPDRWRVGPALLWGVGALIVWEAAGRAPSGRGGRPPLLALAGFAALGLAGLVVLFSATYVAEPLAGRFVAFAALLLTLVILAAGERHARGWRRRAFTVVGVLLTAVALYRVAVKYRLAGREQPTTALNVTISSSYWLGPPRPSGAQLLVAPPSFPFLKRERAR